MQTLKNSNISFLLCFNIFPIYIAALLLSRYISSVIKLQTNWVAFYNFPLPITLSQLFFRLQNLCVCVCVQSCAFVQTLWPVCPSNFSNSSFRRSKCCVGCSRGLLPPLLFSVGQPFLHLSSPSSSQLPGALLPPLKDRIKRQTYRGRKHDASAMRQGTESRV